MIRDRFPVYAGLSARKVRTMRPATAVAAEIAGSITTNQIGISMANL